MSRRTHELLIRDQERLRALAHGLLRDLHAAEDVVQDTWLVAATRGEPVREPAPWLRTVARNLALRRLRGAGRRRAREAHAARPEREGSTSEKVAAIELRRKLLDAVESLREPYRSTVVARYLEDRMPADIAKHDRIPVKTVKTRLSRGLAQLRERLDDRHGSRRAWALPLGALAGGGRDAASASTATSMLAGGVTMDAKTWVGVGMIGAIALGFWVAGGDEPAPTEVGGKERTEEGPGNEPPQLAAAGTAPAAARETSGDPSVAPASMAGRSSEPEKANDARPPPVDRAWRTVTGRILDPDGGGVARVKVLTQQRSRDEEPTSDAHGDFRVGGAETIAGVVEIAFRDVPPTFLRPKPMRFVATGEPVIVTLEPALTVTGRVIAPAGASYASLGIRYQDAETRDTRFSRSGTLGEDGRFVIGGLRPGARIRVIAHDKWHERPGAFAPGVVEDVPAGANDVEVVMRTGHVLEGTAFEADGSPCANKAVMLVPEADAYRGGMGRRAEVDGTFRFTGLAPGVYYAGVSGGTGMHLLDARTRIEVPRPPLELRVAPAPRIEVRLRRPADEPTLDLEKFVVSIASRGGPWHLDGYTYESDEKGAFRIHAVAGSRYDLYVRKAGVPWYARVSDVASGGGPVEVTLERGLRIEGRVVDVNGLPIQGGGHVDLVISRFSPNTPIRADGTFILHGVPPGRHTLRAHPEVSSLALWEHGIEAGRTDVELRMLPTGPGPR